MTIKKKPTRSYAIESACHECMGGYEDHKDCECTSCPLYMWQPYRKLEPDLTWTKFNPKRKGMVTWDESQRNLTEEQRVAAAERLKKAREQKDG